MYPLHVSQNGIYVVYIGRAPYLYLISCTCRILHSLTVVPHAGRATTAGGRGTTAAPPPFWPVVAPACRGAAKQTALTQILRPRLRKEGVDSQRITFLRLARGRVRRAFLSL